MADEDYDVEIDEDIVFSQMMQETSDPLLDVKAFDLVSHLLVDRFQSRKIGRAHV